MSKGVSKDVAQRLWRLLDHIAGHSPTREEMCKHLKCSHRALTGDLGRLRELGIEISYGRISGRYATKWPSQDVPLRFTSEQFFYAWYAVSSLEIDDQGLRERLALAFGGESEPIYDMGLSYGISQGITPDLQSLFSNLRQGVVERRKIVLNYLKPKGESELRMVHPYRLLHTPISWYLAAWCEDRRDFRIFKLARIEDAKVLEDTFKPLDFDIKAHLGDAWWVQKGSGRPTKVEVLFKGEAAQSILEYRFHASQKHRITREGTLVEWRLSYLEEFASWLLQWLGTFQIKRPHALIELIDRRLAAHRAGSTLTKKDPA